MSELRFLVPGMSCRHCAAAITAEVAKASGVETVQVEPATKWVVVCGQDLNIEGIRAAVAKAGHQPDL
ncbi:MAG TPA: heavy-metal-associated domain-containing protein [Actinomycetota bacterium]|jgi:copper chaperone CopZ|nr:heavy-metal-associated domain-containing protein [Actinomycetota bacterium]